jgi:GNAT superfamily N-acetyltransferase
MKPNTQSSIQIRRAVSEDASSIASVLLESFVEYKTFYTEAAFEATTPTSNQIQNRLNEGPVWVAVCEDAIVGTVSAVFQGEAVYIRGMAVLPVARGQRVGESLLSHVESFALAKGSRRLFLSTTPFLNHAIRLYEQFGFQYCEEGSKDLFGTPLFTMVKPLQPDAKAETQG